MDSSHPYINSIYICITPLHKFHRSHPYINSIYPRMYHFLHHFWGPSDGPSGAVGTEGVSLPSCGLGFPGLVCTGRCPGSSGRTTRRPWPWSQGRSDWCPPPGSSPPLGSAGSSPSGGCHPVTKRNQQNILKQWVLTNCRRMFYIIKHRDKCSNESTIQNSVTGKSCPLQWLNHSIIFSLHVYVYHT